MFDVIVVEDKKITREGMMRLIDWASIGGYAAASFSGANAAMEYIAHHHVDLVVTDIEMPDGTGLDLLEYIHENRPEVKTIIISAYEKFSYAHQALALGASAYLLKPVDSKELLQNARRAFDEIESRSHTKTQESYVQWSSMANEIAHHLLDGNPESLQEELAAFDDCFTPINASFLYFRSFGSQPITCQRLREISNEVGQPVFLFPVGQDLCCVLSGILTASDVVLNILFNQWELHLPYYVGVSSPAEGGLSDWRKAFSEARAAFSSAFWTDATPGVYHFSELDVPQTVSLPPHLDYAELKKQLWADSLDSALLHLDQTLDNCRTVNCDIQSAENSFEDTLIRLYDAATLPLPSSTQFRREIAACSSRTELRDVLAARLKHCFQLSSDKKSREVRPIVKLALEYSIKHIDQPELNLKSIAQKLGVSYVYLSKAFKDDFQRGFSEYIASYRIELAKDYLMEPHVHVYEVCAKVGLETKNFHGLFKKYTGMTPKTWQARNIHYEASEQNPD